MIVARFLCAPESSHGSRRTHKVKEEKAKEGKGNRGKEKEGKRTPGKPLTRKCQRQREETEQAKKVELRHVPNFVNVLNFVLENIDEEAREKSQKIPETVLKDLDKE